MALLVEAFWCFASDGCVLLERSSPIDSRGELICSGSLRSCERCFSSKRCAMYLLFLYRSTGSAPAQQISSTSCNEWRSCKAWQWLMDRNTS